MDLSWCISERVPGIAASIDDCVVGFEDTVGEVILAEELPDILDRVQFGGVGRQGQQADIVWHAQSPAALMPAGAIERDHGVGAGADVGADLGEMQAHRLAVDLGQDQADAEIARRTDGAEEIGRCMALIARHGGAGPLAGPEIGQAALLADAGLILPPEFDRLAARMLRDCASDQIGEVFLCASCAARFARG